MCIIIELHRKNNNVLLFTILHKYNLQLIWNRTSNTESIHPIAVELRPGLDLLL
jgi:hypothetical protein